jgi:hypothetical protein
LFCYRRKSFYDKKTIPWRKFRDCTDKFKIIPIRAFIKQFKEEKVVQYIGISFEELHRMKDSDVNWIRFIYPLVDWHIDRNECIEIIKKEGLDIPIKSGCFMCPFQGLESWKSLLINKPELYMKARQMEEQNRTYPKTRLPWKGTLREIENSVKFQKNLFDFKEEPLCGGYCML